MVHSTRVVSTVFLTFVATFLLGMTGRAEQPSLGTARLIGQRSLAENDSVSITNVSKATMLDERRVAICDVITNRILLYDVINGALLASSSQIPFLKDSLYADLRDTYIDSIYTLLPPGHQPYTIGLGSRPFLGYHTCAVTEHGSIEALLQYDYPIRMQDGRTSVFPLIAIVELSSTDLTAIRCTGIRYTHDVWARRYAIAPTSDGQYWISAVPSRTSTSTPFVMCRYDRDGNVVNASNGSDRVVLPQHRSDQSINSIAVINTAQFVRSSYRSSEIAIIRTADGSASITAIPDVVASLLEVKPDHVLLSDPARLTDSTFGILISRDEHAGMPIVRDCVLLVGALDHRSGDVSWLQCDLIRSNDPITAIIEPKRYTDNEPGARHSVQVIAISAGGGSYIATVERTTTK